MTHDKYKAALDAFDNGSWTDEQEQTIRSALQLAQEAEQMRKERDELAKLIIKAQENNDVIAACDAVKLAKKVSDQNGNA